ncbi:hypothetical protein SAMN06265365_1207 [Tistlia consotensis]|uniref:Uncharacterized protein n=1 Tax=Tistlia consotensis USBA 355 TaxID=560819 RepID=A0A1Y6BVU1_9PROT|nr:hypothetical protein [Tistlia consotensis]SMF30442.1 hypothetical protein SAMN05428998_110110 [Tistlia consotensis USBA 355]SNR90015.1 hypothetical protein SAMN06265365_1207 [Tistlia consotensis]
MTGGGRGPVLLYDQLTPGQAFEPRVYRLDEALAAWRRAMPAPAANGAHDEAAVPRGCLVAVMMRGYIEAVTPRPPGNIHAGLLLRWHRTARPGEDATVALRCLDKWQRKGRLWLRFGAGLSTGAGPVLDSEMEFVWAA